MKDEEMAEEYAKELEKKAIDVIRNQSHKLIDNFTQEDLENREISIFLAGYHEGLKAGRPQWHDLGKDPTDLPKKTKEYVVKVKEYGDISVYIGRYWKKEKMFTGSYLKELDVIKWKEIE